MALPFAIRLSWSAETLHYILHTFSLETQPPHPVPNRAPGIYVCSTKWYLSSHSVALVTQYHQTSSWSYQPK
jgi:hypothetical protein